MKISKTQRLAFQSHYDTCEDLEDLEKRFDELKAERDRYKNDLDNLIHSRGLNGETLQEYGTATHRAKELRADLDHCEDECARLKEGLKKAQGYAVKILDARDALQDRLSWKDREVEIKSQHIGTLWGVVSSALELLHDDPDKAGQLLRGGLSKVQMHPMGYCICAQVGECGWCKWNERSEEDQLSCNASAAPAVKIVALSCPITGEYDTDGTNTATISLDPGDDIRLRFDGEVLRFNNINRPTDMGECRGWWVHKNDRPGRPVRITTIGDCVLSNICNFRPATAAELLEWFNIVKEEEGQ